MVAYTVKLFDANNIEVQCRLYGDQISLNENEKFVKMFVGDKRLIDEITIDRSPDIEDARQGSKKEHTISYYSARKCIMVSTTFKRSQGAALKGGQFRHLRTVVRFMVNEKDNFVKIACDEIRKEALERAEERKRIEEERRLRKFVENKERLKRELDSGIEIIEKVLATLRNKRQKFDIEFSAVDIENRVFVEQNLEDVYLKNDDFELQPPFVIVHNFDKSNV